MISAVKWGLTRAASHPIPRSVFGSDTVNWRNMTVCRLMFWQCGHTSQLVFLGVFSYGDPSLWHIQLSLHSNISCSGYRRAFDHHTLITMWTRKTLLIWRINPTGRFSQQLGELLILHSESTCLFFFLTKNNLKLPFLFLYQFTPRDCPLMQCLAILIPSED